MRGLGLIFFAVFLVKELNDQEYRVKIVDGQPIDILHKHPLRLGGGALLLHCDSTGLYRTEPVCSDKISLTVPPAITRWEDKNAYTIRLLY